MYDIIITYTLLLHAWLFAAGGTSVNFVIIALTFF
jgi:hypothetical protein